MRRYVEPARTYVSTLVLLGAVIAGFLIDLLVIGGGRAHVLAWIIGGVLVVGLDALITSAARQLRSIVVTDDDLTVGEETLPRNEILGIDLGDVDNAPLLGRRFGEGLPRGTAALTLALADGRKVAVATRRPQRLAEVLGAAGGDARGAARVAGRPRAPARDRSSCGIAVPRGRDGSARPAVPARRAARFARGVRRREPAGGFRADRRDRRQRARPRTRRAALAHASGTGLGAARRGVRVGAHDGLRRRSLSRPMPRSRGTRRSTKRAASSR